MKKLLALALATCLALASPAAFASAPTPLVVGVLSAGPHAEILEFVREDLRALGYELDLIKFTVSALPNPVLSAKEMDANFFQDPAFMDDYNAYAAESERLSAAFAVHYAPFALYAGKAGALSELGEGGVIAIPDDPIDGARALWLLRDAGLIELPESAQSIEYPAVPDIAANPWHLEIREVEAAALPAAQKEADFVVMSAGAALDAGLNPAADAVFLEPADSLAAGQYATFVVVREADLDAEFTKALRQVLLTQKVSDFILTNDAYRGGIAPAFSAQPDA